MVVYLEQKKIHFDLRFILTYNIYANVCREGRHHAEYKLTSKVERVH